jgi:hypothetical protein
MKCYYPIFNVWPLKILFVYYSIIIKNKNVMRELKLTPEQFKINDKWLRGPIYNENELVGYEEEWKIMKIENNSLFFENGIIWRINDLSLTSLYNIKRD